MIKAQNVTFHSAGAIEPSEHLLATRPGGLPFRSLAPRRAVIFLKLVRAIERGGILRRGEAGSNTIAVDGNFTVGKLHQLLFVQAAAGDDPYIGQPAMVEDTSHLHGVFGEISAIDADASEADSRLLQPGRQVYNLPRGSFRIVGVDQKDRAIRPCCGEVDEGVFLAGVHLDERMRHRPVDGYAKPTGRRRGGASGEARQIARPCRQKTGVRAMCASEAEVHQRLASGRQNHTRRLRCDNRLKMQQIDDLGLNQLSFCQRRGDPQNRFICEKDRAFGHGIYIAGEAEMAQRLDEFRVQSCIRA